MNKTKLDIAYDMQDDKYIVFLSGDIGTTVMVPKGEPFLFDTEKDAEYAQWHLEQILDGVSFHAYETCGHLIHLSKVSENV